MQPPAYVAYYRVSTQMQGKSGLGLQAQRTSVHTHIGVANLIAEFTEIESGKNDDRPQLQAAIEFAKRSNATLLIAKLDRLSRDVHFISGLMKQEVNIVALDMPHANKFQWHIMAAVAEQERDFISERTKAAIAEKRANGAAWGTNAAKTDKAVAHAETMRGFVQSLNAGGIVSPAAIARELNQRGYTTITGKRWHIVQVQRLLERLA